MYLQRSVAQPGQLIITSCSFIFKLPGHIVQDGVIPNELQLAVLPRLAQTGPSHARIPR